ncbi:MAG: type IV secretory system conjugative DNA transfer family protein [Pseudomonadota bacterium]
MSAHNKHQAVEPRVNAGPVNTYIVFAFIVGCFAYAIRPSVAPFGAAHIMFGVLWIMSFIFGMSALSMLVRDYRLRRDLARSRLATTNHGSARQATRKERRAHGMDDAASGDLLGLDEKNRAVFRPPQAPFGLYEMPPGVGKTVCYVIPSILHQAMSGKSLVIADVKTDLAPMLVPGLRKLGFEVWCVNPTGAHAETCPDTELNPYQSLVDAVYEDGPGRMDAAKFANDFASIHYPPTKDEKNPYFVNGSRRAILAAALETAITDPARCAPTSIYNKLTDPGLFLKRMDRAANTLQSARGDGDPLIEFLRGEARNLLHRAKKNEENFASFLEGASQRLLTFNPSGRLGGYGSTAIRNIAELRERQIILFIMTPLSHQREFAPFISLLNHNIIAACKARPDGHPVHIVAEEALNYKFTNLTSDLEVMRQLGVSADFFIQSFAGLEKNYGREAAQAIESYADVRVYAGLNSLARAKHLSELLSEETIRKQDYNLQADVRQLGLSSAEQARPLMKPNEVLAMSRRHCWAFVRGMNPIYLRMVHYGQVNPWRDWVSASPMTGERLHSRPVVRINYPNKEQK